MNLHMGQHENIFKGIEIMFEDDQQSTQNYMQMRTMFIFIF